MAKSIKLGSDTYLDASGVAVNSSGETLTNAIGGLRIYAQNSIAPGTTATIPMSVGGGFLLFIYRSDANTNANRIYIGCVTGDTGNVAEVSSNTGTAPTITVANRAISITNNMTSATIHARVLSTASNW